MLWNNVTGCSVHLYCKSYVRMLWNMHQTTSKVYTKATGNVISVLWCIMLAVHCLSVTACLCQLLRWPHCEWKPLGVAVFQAQAMDGQLAWTSCLSPSLYLSATVKNWSDEAVPNFHLTHLQSTGSSHWQQYLAFGHHWRKIETASVCLHLTNLYIK